MCPQIANALLSTYDERWMKHHVVVLAHFDMSLESSRRPGQFHSGRRLLTAADREAQGAADTRMLMYESQQLLVTLRSGRQTSRQTSFFSCVETD